MVEHIVSKWSPAPLGTTPLPTDRDTFESWERDFEARANPAQRKAYAAYVQASVAALKVRHLADGPETATLRDAEDSLRSHDDRRGLGRLPRPGEGHRSAPAVWMGQPRTSRVLQRVLGATMDLQAGPRTWLDDEAIRRLSTVASPPMTEAITEWSA